MDLPVFTSLTSCLHRVDVDIFSGFAEAKSTFAEESQRLGRGSGRESSACRRKHDKCY